VQKFDRELVIDRPTLVPLRELGNKPWHGAPITAKVPDPAETTNEQERKGLERALEYMGLKPARRWKKLQLTGLYWLLHQFRVLKIYARLHELWRTQGGFHGERHGFPGSSGREGVRLKKRTGTKVFREAGFRLGANQGAMCLGMNPDICLRRTLRLDKAIATLKAARDAEGARTW